MNQTVKAIIAALRSAERAGHGMLTAADIKTLERLAKSHAELVDALEVCVQQLRVLKVGEHSTALVMAVPALARAEKVAP